MNMKTQLHDCNLGKNIFFGYSSIPVAFFFDWIPTFSPRVRLPPTPPCEPRLTQWGDVFLRQGGGEIWGGFDDDFYPWGVRKVPAFE